jgi:rhodanese-related sulfurtransferase
MKILLSSALLSIALASPLSAQQTTPAPPAQQAPHKNVTPEEAEKLIQTQKDLVIIDVRTPEEFNAGHIAGAKNVSILEGDFERKLKEHQGKPLLLHCASGSRSARALTKMRDLRVPEIYHMNGGIKAWKDAGKSVMKTPPGEK